MSKIFNDTSRNIYLANCLYDCIEDNNVTAVEKLLKEKQANANTIIPDKGITPFHLAIGSGDESIAEEITKIILTYGGNPNVRSVDCVTPVHISCAWGRLNILKLLLKHGGDISLKDEDERTCLDFARIENHLDIVLYIQNYTHNISNIDVYNSSDDTRDRNYIRESGIQTIHYSSEEDVLNEQINSQTSPNKILNVSDDDNIINSCITISSAEIGDKIHSRLSILTIHDSSEEHVLNERINSQLSLYETCESNDFEKNINSSLMTSDLSVKDSLISEDLSVKKSSDNEKILNVEEYEYVDEDQGIRLIEQRIVVNSYDSDSSSLNSMINYDTDTIRKELTILGENPGPITKTTKRVYLKRLKKLRKISILELPVANNNNTKVYSVELQKTLKNPNWTTDLTQYEQLESSLVSQFNKTCGNQNWREGNTKTSFTYLLLDPRVSQNLPARAQNLSQNEIWTTFISSIFYVGKGKRSRPYSHLYEAVNFWNNGLRSHHTDKKINYILNVWNNKFGVVCLHIFQNVMPVEAYTREAAMINALKVQNLCNLKTGNFYGVCTVWPEKKKRLLGVYLLYKAMLILLNEGERQLLPNDIAK